MEPQQTGPEPAPIENEREVEVEEMFRAIERSGALPERVAAFDAADAVLCALAMRLPRADAVNLAGAMPMRLRRIIARCVAHEGARPVVSLDQLSFLRLIATDLRIPVEDAERLTRAVFVAVQRLLPEDQIWDIRNRLPRELDALWYPYSQSGLAGFEAPSAAAPEDVLRGPRPFEEPTETIVREVEQSGVLPDGGSAIEAIRAVLCTLAREMTGTEARDFAALSPRTLRGLLERCVGHRAERPEAFDQATFLRHVAEHLGIDDTGADRVSRTVFAALRARMPADEIALVDNRLPRSVRKLWKP